MPLLARAPKEVQALPLFATLPTLVLLQLTGKVDWAKSLMPTVLTAATRNQYSVLYPALGIETVPDVLVIPTFVVVLSAKSSTRWSRTW